MKEKFIGSLFNRLILKSTLLAGRIAAHVTRHRLAIQLIVGSIAMVLGFWGWMIARPPADVRDFSGILDNVFRTAQLITLQFPNNFQGHIPYPLQIARLMLPAIAVLASFQVLIGSITRPARLALLPYSTGHIIVYGSEALTEAALISLASRGQQVAVIMPQVDAVKREQLEGLGLTIVEKTLRGSENLVSLNLPYATALLLTGNDDVENATVAMLAVSAKKTRPKTLPPFVLACRLDEETLAAEFAWALDGLSRQHNVRFCRLCPAREGVRLELSRFAPVFLKANKSLRSHVLIVGLAGNWQQIVMQIIIACQDHPTKSPVLSFALNDSEAEALQRWRQDRPELELIVDLVIFGGPIDTVLPSERIAAPWLAKYGSPHLVVVLREDPAAITVALALRRPGNSLGADTTPVLVHQSREDRLLTQLRDTPAGDRDLTNLMAIGGLVRAESIERVLDRKGEEVAIALHAHYVEAAKSLGSSSPNAIEAWDELSENLKNANRASADHAPILFASAGLELTKMPSSAAAVSFTRLELDCMAQVEHRRWVADRIDRGWRFGRNRDDKLMRHPSLVPYNQLSENDKVRDENAVRVLASVLQDSGYRLIRSQPGGPGHAD